MPFVQNTTDLGVTTNSEIKFSTQITSAVSKARQMVAMLNRTVSKMPLEVLLTAYSALWKLGNMSQGDKQSQQEQKKSCPSLIFFSRVNPATTPIVSQWAPTVTIKSRKKGRPLRSPEITFSESMSPQAPQCIRKDPDDMLVRRVVTLVIRELHLSGTHSRRWHTARFNPVISLQTHQGFFLFVSLLSICGVLSLWNILLNAHLTCWLICSASISNPSLSVLLPVPLSDSSNAPSTNKSGSSVTILI